MSNNFGNNIVPAGLGRRIGGFLIDSVVCGGLIALLYFTLGGALSKKMGLDTMTEETVSFLVESKLGYTDEKRTSFTTVYHEAETYVEDDITYRSYEDFESRVWQYYTVFLADEGTFLEGDGFEGNPSNVAETGKWVVNHVYGLSLEKKDDNPYYTLAKVSGEDSDSVQPVLKENIANILENGTDIEKKQTLIGLKNYFSTQTGLNSTYDDKEPTGIFLDAVKHLAKQPRYLQLIADANKAFFLSRLPCFLIPPILVFLVVPMAIPNGKTLGKLALQSAVISVSSYKAKWWNILLRQLFIVFLWEFLLIPNQMFGITAFLIALAIDFAVLAIGRSGRALHDRLGGTFVINSKQSVWFKDEEDEAEYAASHPEFVASLEDAVESLPVANNPAPKTVNGRKLVGDEYDPTLAGILDLSTIDRHREEARNMKSFDEFEQSKEKELADLMEKQQKNEDLAAMEEAEAMPSNEPNEEDNPTKVEEKDRIDEENGGFADEGE